MSNEITLKPCPACGGTDVLLTVEEKSVYCLTCKMVGPHGDYDAQRWNALPRRDDIRIEHDRADEWMRLADKLQRQVEGYQNAKQQGANLQINDTPDARRAERLRVAAIIAGGYVDETSIDIPNAARFCVQFGDAVIAEIDRKEAK